MTKKKESEEKYEKRSLTLITTEGKVIIVNYQISDNSDDLVLGEIREALGSNRIYCGESWSDFEIKFGDETISELDFKKIIGMSW